MIETAVASLQLGGALAWEQAHPHPSIKLQGGKVEDLAPEDMLLILPSRKPQGPGLLDR